MKRRVVSFIMGIVLSVAMVVPCMADEVEAIAEEISIEEEVVLEESTLLEDDVDEEVVVEEIVESDYSEDDIIESEEYMDEVEASEIVTEDIAVEDGELLDVEASTDEEESYLISFERDEEGNVIYPDGFIPDEEDVASEDKAISKTDAKSIAFGKTYNVNWNETTTKYTYNYVVKFNVTQKGIVKYTSSKPIDSRGRVGMVELIVYDSNLNAIGFNGSYHSSSNSNSKYVYSIGLNPGTYYMHIDPQFSFYKGSSDMSYSFAFSPQDYCEIESNETPEKATPMQLNRMYLGYYSKDGVASILNLEENDYYAVNLMGGQTYKLISTDANNYLSTTTLIVVEYNGKTKFYLSSCMQRDQLTDSYGNIYTEFTPEESGTYYVKVYNCGREQFEYHIGIYDADGYRPNPAPSITPAPTPVEYEKGWQKDDKGWWYQNSDGSRKKSCWAKIGGKYYRFDSNGYRRTGWIKVSGKKYYLSSKGVRKTGWVKIKSKWYYFNSKGVMKTGWVKVKGKWYYLSSKGIMKTGWVKVKGKYYYLYKDGHMASNTWIGKYHVNGNGERDGQK